MKNFFVRRWMVILLILTLVIPAGVPAFAGELDYNYQSGTRLNLEGNYIYFGLPTLNLNEENRVYGIPVYRDGDLTKQASVKIKTLDITASYGKDYILMGDDIIVKPQDKTLLEKVSTEDYSGDNVSFTVEVEDVDIDQTDATDAKEIPKSNTLESLENSGKSSLALLKEKQTGIEARESAFSGTNDSIAEGILGGFAPQVLEKLGNSSESLLTFKPGESVAYVNIRILDDLKSEGNESFSIFLQEATNAEIYSQAETCSVMIIDNEPKEYSVFEFDKAVLSAKNGVVEAVVKRTGAEYSMATLDIVSDSETLELQFAPFEMEKTVTIDVLNSGKTTLQLGNVKGGSLGDKKNAYVIVTEKQLYRSSSLLMGSQGSDEKQFTLNMTNNNGSDGKLVVKYTPGKNYGKIYDTSYSPELNVGTYFFAGDESSIDKSKLDSSIKEESPIYFEYGSDKLEGDKPNGLGTWESYYDSDNARGVLKYYNTTTWKEGSMKCTSQGRLFPHYYQFIAPDWSQSQDFSDSASESVFYHDGTEKYKTRKFGREVGLDVAIPIKSLGYTTPISVKARDRNGGKTPKIYVYFNGLVAMYRQFNVTAENPTNLTFYKYGTNDKVTVPAANFNVRCGAQSFTSNQTRSIFSNPDVNQATMVFSLDNVEVFGRSGKYGYISGYTLTTKNGGRDKTLSYPIDYISYLNDDSRCSGLLDYSKTAVNNKMNEVREHLDTIKFDEYFVEWVKYMNIDNITGRSPYNYYQFKFKPKFNYINVNVEVVEPYSENNDPNCKADFNYSPLAAGTKHTFHAGDVLVLDSTAKYPDEYRVEGYEVSTDGGVTFNSIRNTNELFLEPNENYIIRPLLVAKDFYIEIEMTEEAKKHLTILDTYDYNAEDGSVRKVLYIDKTKTEIKDKVKPEVGQIYMIRAMQNALGAPSGQEYRPVLKDNLTGEIYNGNIFYITCRNGLRDNRYTLDAELVSKSELVDGEITGTLMLRHVPIRDTGIAPDTTPLENYSVSLNSNKTIKAIENQNEINTPELMSAQTDANGNFAISGIKMKNGDKMTMLVSNGLFQNEIVTFTVDTRHLNIGKNIIDYPDFVPVVTSVDYNFADSTNNQKQGYTDNSVHIYDDTFYVTAHVSNKGKNLKSAIFTFVSPDGRREEYPVESITSNNSMFKLQIDDMLNKIKNGSRLMVRLVDNDKIPSSEENIEYPNIDTGLVFYVENEIVLPKYISIDDSDNTVELPILGRMNTAVNSGVFSFSRVDYEESNAFSLILNMNALLFNNKPTLTSAQKEDRIIDFYNRSKRVSDNDSKGSAASNGAASSGGSSSSGLNISEDDLSGSESSSGGASSGGSSTGSDNGSQTPGLDDVKWAGDVISSTVNGDDGAKATKSKTPTEQSKDFEKIAKDGKETPHGFADINKATHFSISVAIIVAIDFAYNYQTDSYDAYQLGITIGGTFQLFKTFYTIIYAVPCYFNVSGLVQPNYNVGAVIADNGPAYEDFSRYSENVAEYLNSYVSKEVAVKLGATGQLKGQVGVGVCGILGVRGYGDFSVQFQIGLVNAGSGILQKSAGGIGFDILIGSIDVNIFTQQVGTGVLKSEPQFKWFDGKLDGLLTGRMVQRNSTLIKEVDDGNISFVDYNSGNVPTELNSGTAVGAQPGVATINRLMDNVADRTRPSIVDLGNGKKFITFIGTKSGNAQGTNGLNDMRLYYSVYDGEEWSTPSVVWEDGTFDTTPTVIREGNKVIIAWSNATRAFKKSDSAIDKLKTLGISVAVYDIDKNTISIKKHPKIDDYLNINPKLTANGDKVYLSYVKRDIGGITSPEQLLDLAGTYYTMAYVCCDMKSGHIGNEVLVNTRNTLGIDDPFVTSYGQQVITIKNNDYMVTCFTIDGDNNLQTHEDRELYLEISDLTHDKQYYPIRITNNNVSDENAKLSKLNGNLYLTWVADTDRMTVYNVSELLEYLFHNGAAGDSYKKVDPNDPYWYKQQVNLGSGMTESYDTANNGESVYHDLYSDIHRVVSQRAGNDMKQIPIGEYVLVSDGKDDYILFTAPGSSPLSTGKELYGMRYNDEGAILTPAVQITDSGAVIDEIDAYMDQDGNISLVANLFYQWINAQGAINYSGNSLVEVEFVPTNSLYVDESSINIADELIPGNTVGIKFNVENRGLQRADGFTAKVEYVKDGKRTLIEDIKRENAILYTNDESEIMTSWKVPNDISGGRIEISVVESNIARTSHCASFELDGEAKPEIIDAKIIKGDTNNTYTVTYTNSGNSVSENLDLAVYVEGKNGKSRLMGRKSIGTVAPGEIKKAEFTYKPLGNDFNNLGIVNVYSQLEVGSVVKDRFYSRHRDKSISIEDDELVKVLLGNVKLKAKSVKTKKGNIKVTVSANEAGIKAITDMGYAVKYKFYRSTKKASSYKGKLENTTGKYTNTSGKKGTRYYYKARLMVYDAKGKLVAKTELKQCSYASRIK